MREVLHGDCRMAFARFDADAFDAIVTDPPYGLGFMGKGWDHGVPGAEFWAEFLRVAKPGAYLVAFGGTRTWHRLACAIEDAGWEIRDTLAWMYGQGFPKSLDVSKAIDAAAGAERETGPIDPARAGRLVNQRGDYTTEAGWSAGNRSVTIDLPSTDAAKQWAGWGTALKPAFEPIILARKPLIGTVAANVLAHGTGGLNIDGSRIAFASEADKASATPQGKATAKSGALAGGVQHDGERSEFVAEQNAKGRWPANVILDEDAAVLLDAQTGVLTSGKAAVGGHKRKGSLGAAGGAALGGNADGSLRSDEDAGVLYADSGGASRFFYVAKASKSERTHGGTVENKHPTVKPLALMRWLVRLVTPPGGRVLDPFCGSGTTLVACAEEGFDCIGIEQDASSVETARARSAMSEP